MATPYALVYHGKTTSTQDEARRLLGRHPMLVVAGEQTVGRGRSGAGWENAPQALAASLAFRPNWPSDMWPRLTLVAGVAAARVLGLSLKWPNDVMRDDAKIGGILTEVSGAVAVIGLGLNLHWPDSPTGMGAVFDEAPASGTAIEMAQAWTEQVLGIVEDGPERWPLDEYRARCRTIGREITWKPDGRGLATGIDATGALEVTTADGATTLGAGAVHEVRPLPGSGGASGA
jgi:BirA family biotin operon repressor/biotin-[acetyl-CoA-carboxylase] ligase